MSPNNHTKNETIVLIGQAFAAERASRGLGVKTVADALLLSSLQIEDIEAGCLTHFYNERLYRRCADKYAAYLGVSPLPSERLQVFTNSETNLTEAVPQRLLLASKSTGPHLKTTLRFALLVVLLALGVLYWVNPSPARKAISEAQGVWQSINSPTTQAAQPKPAIQPVAIAPVTQEEPRAEAIPNNTIRLNFNSACWIQSVGTNGQKSEKTYQAGETLEISPQSLQALIIGNRKAVTLLSPTGTEIRLNEFTNLDTNVVRIVGNQIRNLGHN